MKSKNTTYLTKVFSFCAAHQYGNKKWSDQENWEVFGKDTRVHGHNYTLHVTVTGEINPDSIFYLRSRGIKLEDAKKMLLNGFLNETIDSININFFKKNINKKFNRWLIDVN